MLMRNYTNSFSSQEITQAGPQQSLDYRPFFNTSRIAALTGMTIP